MIEFFLLIFIFTIFWTVFGYLIWDGSKYHPVKWWKKWLNIILHGPMTLVVCLGMALYDNVIGKNAKDYVDWINK